MRIAEEVHRALRGRPGRFAIYGRNLVSNETILVGDTDTMPAESAAKTFILVHYARLVNEGVLDPTSRVAYTPSDHCLGSGVLRFLSTGLTLSLDDLAWLMIIISDNLATHLMLETVGGPPAVNDRMAELGLTSARLNTRFSHTEMMTDEPFSTSTAHDLAEIYCHLDDRCRTILFRQQFVDYLPRRLPHASQAEDFGITMPVRVFNKTGGGLGTCTDSGLFETDDSCWVVGAMAADQQDFASRADDSAPTAFADIGEIFYQHWGQTEPRQPM
jgi:beta-lactamase class A